MEEVLGVLTLPEIRCMLSDTSLPDSLRKELEEMLREPEPEMERDRR
jgi:hypothetical protein